MRLSRTAAIYIAIMLVAGVVIGAIALARPHWREAPLPPVAWPLGVSLLLDLALTPLVASGRLPPLTMNERLAGFVGAGLIVTAILAALG